MGVGAALVGGAVSAFGASKARKDSRRNARRVRSDGLAAAEDVYFKPVGLTSNAGSVSFNDSGSPSIQLDSRYQGLQDSLFGGAQRTAASLNNYNPEQAAQRLADQQFALIQPQMQADQANLAQTLFGTGRGGLTVSGSGAGAGTGGMVNPDVFGFNQAMAQQRAQIAADSQDRALQQQAAMQGLLGGQLQQIGAIGSVEDQLLAQALQLEAQRGQQAAAAGGIRTGTSQAAAGIQGQGDRAFTNALTGLGTGFATAGVNSLFKK